MPQRKVWSAQQDKILKYLREEVKIPKWSIIARKMQEEHSMPGRTGKQCRERYHNHLDSTIIRSDWTRQQQQFLYTLHNQVGNKWAIIAQKMPGRSDNCVKNHFYSKMRKAIRKLNKVIHQEFRRQFKEIKMSVLYKIVEAADQKFKQSSQVQNQVSQLCFLLKNMLLEYSNDDDNSLDGNLLKLKQLAFNITKFNTQFHKKKKKSRRSSLSGQQILALPKFQPKSNSYSQQQNSEQYNDDAMDEENSEEIQQQQQKVKKSRFQEIQPIPQELKESNNSSVWNCFRYKDSRDFGMSSLKIQPNELKDSVRKVQNGLNKDLNLKLEMSSDQAQIQNILMNQGALRFDQRPSKNNLLQRLPNIRAQSSDESAQGDDMFGMQEQNINMKMLGDSMQGLKIKDEDYDMNVIEDEDKLFVST